MRSKLEQVNTLVFEGGSVKGLTYVGALQVLETYSQEKKGQPFLAQIEHVAGTSAGAITALLIALGLSLEQITIVMRETGFASFADSGWYGYGGNVGKGAAIYNHGYICEGLAFTKWVNGLLSTYAGNEAITFAELHKKTNKDLHVYAVRLNDSKIISLNAEQTPHVSVALAVRMSMSIPVFFKAVRVRESLDSEQRLQDVILDEENGTTYYVDGGVKANYPYQLIKASKNLRDEQLLGFKVDSNQELLNTASAQGAGKYLQPLALKRNEIKGGYGKHLIPYMLNALMSPQDDAHRQNTFEYSRTIYCWDCDVSTFDFKLKNKQIEGLVASGSSAAQFFIEKLEQISQAQQPTLEEKESQVTQQVKTVQETPITEVEFTTKYKAQEAARVNLLLQDTQQSLQSSQTITSEQQEAIQAYVNGLKSDMHKISSSILIQGKAGDIEAEIATATQVNPKDFDKASEHVLKLVEKGIYRSLHVAAGAQAGNVKDKIGNITIAQGFFAQLRDTSFLSEADNLLDELEKDKAKYDSRAIKRISRELEEAISFYNKNKNAIEKDRSVIEAIENTKEDIILKTAELKVELKKVKESINEEEKKTWEGKWKPCNEGSICA